MPIIKYRRFLNLILFFSIFALISAYFIQYILGHQPCNLCLIERVPYISAVTIILLCFYLKKFEKICLIFLSLIFLMATILSFYHFGIEQGFIKESLVCDLDVGEKILNPDELLKKLKDKTVSCRDVTFKIFGLSLATINIIISLILSIITMKHFLNYEKNR
ncbi:disulfide bond formation protein B [Candidatus Pelagibacter sp.]|nr:disulfide bond formation protein B [Candidatus Pelagibacter sp.]